MFVEICAMALWLFSPRLLQRDPGDIESCAQCMSLLGALTPDEMAERCFPSSALLKALIGKEKICGYKAGDG